VIEQSFGMDSRRPPSALRPARRALANVFTKASFSESRKAKATPFNLILEAKI